MQDDDSNYAMTHISLESQQCRDFDQSACCSANPTIILLMLQIRNGLFSLFNSNSRIPEIVNNLNRIQMQSNHSMLKRDGKKKKINSFTI